ncbi:hypothetical protein H3Z85_13580 [Chryseobacterium indologenes]|uniref:hypothetical protein n=1 Tax=Chryseobacterium indologenes TaxID=253 RepID=UPI0004B83098|nr:hypothetical protein [Chryseobacterium indologenes]QPQ50492.1 hypothetical protein H3Z85_13580 [Chryseobacterium indologenes]SFJ35200.1 hypothetical protein SAMN05421692_1703 [Chryseobacterium indologenes]SUX53149.1 Uncharacterised protein [Chryseobacterium indologenes]
MSRGKFILLYILKTWGISLLISVIFLIIFLYVLQGVKERPRNCDMSGLAYVFVVFWITFLSSVSLSSLLSLLKQFQKGIMSGLCWFLLPAVVILYSFFAITNGKINGQETVLFLILNIPWILVWIFYYYRFTTVFK